MHGGDRHDPLDPLHPLADAIAEGRPIAWADAERQLGPKDLDTLAELRIIAEIARLHRASHDSMEQSGAAADEAVASNEAMQDNASAGIGNGTAPSQDADVSVDDSREPSLLLESLELPRLTAAWWRSPRPSLPQGGAASPPSLGTRPALFTWGSLRVLSRVGEGAFGEVFHAWDTALEREVALKLLRSTPSAESGARDAIIREGQRLARVHQLNVMAIYGAQQIDGRVGIWGEYLRGRTLAAIVDDDGPLSALEAIVCVDAVCRALTAVHNAGLLHRDVKAQNVMREAGGRIVLMDFGLGREMGAPTDSERERPPTPGSSSPGAPGGRVSLGFELAGTPLYLAPELFRGETASARSDIYAVGVLLFYLVTGRFPVDGRSLQEIAANHAAGIRARLQDLRSDLPDAFVQTVERALIPDRAGRFESAGALQAALSAAHVVHAAPVETTRPRATAMLWLWVPLLLLTLTASALAFAAWHGWHAGPRGEPVELTLMPPPGLTLTEGSRNVPAVSPDGRHIAFLTTNTSGAMQLWIRSLADPTPRLIPNSEGATRPFWSPDGSWLAYFLNRGEDSGLWRVTSSGAQPERLAIGTESRGGSWGRDDTLVLALEPNKGLQQMSARPGAAPVWATRVDTGRKESQHMWPQFLPDGRHFIFFVLSSDDDVEGIYLGSLDENRPKRLVKTHTSALYTAGSLVYTTNDRLFAQRLDLTAGALTGEAHPVDLAVGATYDWLLLLSISDTRTLVYRRSDLRQLVWYDLTGQELEHLGAADNYRNPVLSRDGAFVVAERYHLGLRELVAFDLARGGPPDALPLPARPSCPVWGPDGRLAFAASPTLTSALYVTDIHSPRDWKLLVSSPYDEEPTDWSRDGRSLAYMMMEPGPAGGRNQNLWLASPDDGKPVPWLRSEHSEVSAMFSPNGQWIAYVTNEEGTPHVYIRKPDGSSKLRVFSGEAYDPQWQSDEQLLYLDKEGYLWRATIPPDRPVAMTTMRMFRTPIRTPRTSRSNYALDLPRGRILFNAWPRDSASAVFSVILNWPDPMQPR